MLSRFPCGPGVSLTVAPSAVTRSVNTFLKLCSRCDSGLGSPGSCVVSDQLIVSDGAASGVPEVRIARRCRSAADRDTRLRPPTDSERDEAPVAGEPLLVLAGTVTDPFPRPVQQVPHPLRVGELGEVAGAAGDDVVQQQRLAGRRRRARRRVR